MTTTLKPTSPLGSLELLGLGAALGIASGLVEAAATAVKSGRTILLVGQVGDFVWLAPLVGCLLGIGAALLVLGGRRLAPRVFTARVALTVMLTVVVLSPLFLFQRMHRLATVLLAVGIAFQLAGWLNRRLGSERRFRWLLPLVVTLWLLGGAGLEAVRMLREDRALRALPAADPNRPNVLLLVLDTVRSMSLDLYGNPRPTSPAITSWSRHGARFDFAVVPAPWTLPSHASMFTGRLPRELSTTLRAPLDEKFPVLAEALAGHGYVSGGFVANIWYCAAGKGLERGFLHYRDYPRTLQRVPHATALGRWLFDQEPVRRMLGWYEMLWRKDAVRATDEFLRWEEQPRDGRPFFAFINYFDAHNPFIPPAPFDTLFATKRAQSYAPRREMPGFEEMSRDEIAATHELYEGAIAYLDQTIGRMLEELERRGVLQHTIVIITSDHGEQFGERQLIGHGNSLYNQLLQVPLVIIYPPRVPEGTVVAAPVTLRDLPATVLDLSGLPNEVGFQGRSLARFWGAPGSTPLADEVIISELPGASSSNAFTLIADGHQYIRWFKRPDVVYDLRADRTTEANLVGTPRGDSLQIHFRALAAALALEVPALKKGEASDTL